MMLAASSLRFLVKYLFWIFTKTKSKAVQCLRSPFSASKKERRSSMKDARKTIKSGRKDRNSANKATVIRSEFGKTRVNNRAANAAAGGGTKVGNLIRSVFGGRKNPSRKQNKI